MKIIGITGGIGAGKTTVCKRFEKRGVDVIDCDKIARDVTAPGSACLDELVSAFGDEILNEDGSLNRAALAEKTFGEGDTKTLNKITHRYISIECNRIIAEKEKEGARYIGIEASLLLDSDIKELCDYTLAVLADKEMRIDRVISRDNLSREQVLERMDKQRGDEFFKKNASFCIYNDGNGNKLNSDVDDFLDNYVFGGKKLKKTKNKKNNRPPILRFIALAITFIALIVAVCYFFLSSVETNKKKAEYRSDIYSDYVEKYSDMYNVQKLRVFSIIKETSNFDPGYESDSGNKGLMQVSDSVFSYVSGLCGIETKSDDIYDPEKNIRVGTYYLAMLTDEFGDIDYAEAAYLLGESEVQNWVKGIDQEKNDITLQEKIKNNKALNFVTDINDTFEKYVSLYPDMYTRPVLNPEVKTHPINLYKDQILLYSDAYEIPASYVYSLILTESNFTETAVSGSGSVGLMQINKSGIEAIQKKFGEDIDADKLLDAELNIKYGVYYLRYLYDKFDSLNLALVAYEAGEDNVIKWIQNSSYYGGGKIRKTPFVQINDYIENINNNREMYLKFYPEIFNAEEK